jgi:hypothetical protein
VPANLTVVAVLLAHSGRRVDRYSLTNHWTAHQSCEPQAATTNCGNCYNLLQVSCCQAALPGTRRKGELAISELH